MVAQQHNPIMIDLMVSGGLPTQSALIPVVSLVVQPNSLMSFPYEEVGMNRHMPD
jgi:hypothetical protein